MSRTTERYLPSDERRIIWRPFWTRPWVAELLIGTTIFAIGYSVYWLFG